MIKKFADPILATLTPLPKTIDSWANDRWMVWLVARKDMRSPGDRDWAATSWPPL
jgi:hypothetical protein